MIMTINIDDLTLHIGVKYKGKYMIIKHEHVICLTRLNFTQYYVDWFQRPLLPDPDAYPKSSDINVLWAEYYPRYYDTTVPAKVINKYMSILSIIFPEIINVSDNWEGIPILIQASKVTGQYMNALYRAVRGVEESPRHVEAIVALYNQGVDPYAALAIGSQMVMQDYGIVRRDATGGHYILPDYGMNISLQLIDSLRSMVDRGRTTNFKDSYADTKCYGEHFSSVSDYMLYGGNNEIDDTCLLNKVDTGSMYTLDEFVKMLPEEVMQCRD